jgi:predicted amidohydrolase YtcJ
MRSIDSHPNLIAYNGEIHTMDNENSVVEAIAVLGGRITALGSDHEVKSLAGPATELMDLEGRTVIPGLFDGHIHLLERGVDLTWIRLHECESVDEMLSLVRDRVARAEPGEWIIGRGWNDERFVDGRMPTRRDIDPISPDNPVVLIRQVQAYLVDSSVLDMIGFDDDTPSPDGGTIGRFEDGSLNGLLWGSAKNVVQKFMPQPDVETMIEALRMAVHELHTLGVTSVVEPGLRPFEIGGFQSFYEAGELSARVNMMVSWHGYWADLETEEELERRIHELGIHSGFGDEWLRIGGLKMAMDVAFIPPTTDGDEGPAQPDEALKVFHRLDVDLLPDYCRTAHELRWDIGMHCHSDRLQDLVLDAIEDAHGSYPWDDARHSIIHGEIPTPRSLRKMADLDVALVAQPGFLYYKGFLNLDEDIVQRFQPIRTYMDHGVQVISSSDVPYAPEGNPFVGLYALVTRRNNDGRVLGPDQGIGREEALRTYTEGAAWLTREEHLKGTIELGKLGDFVVLDRDYFTIPEEEIKDIRVDATVIGGEVVYVGE